MARTALHDDDIYAWSEHQAKVLRGLAAVARLPNDLDLEHVAEEIEALGAAELNAVRSHLVGMLVHVIRAAAVPGALPVRKWLDQIDLQHRQATLCYSESMRQRIDLDVLWRAAVRDASAALRRYGDPVPALPLACPFELGDLLDETVDAGGAPEAGEA